MATSVAFKRNQKALKMAVSQTKAQLKKVEKKVEIITYPKGVWKETLEKNFDKNVKILGGKPAKVTSTKKAAAKKVASKSKNLGGKPAKAKNTKNAVSKKVASKSKK